MLARTGDWGSLVSWYLERSKHLAEKFPDLLIYDLRPLMYATLAATDPVRRLLFLDLLPLIHKSHFCARYVHSGTLN
jgi:hypothetical protein